jgi:hypothetical protein
METLFIITLIFAAWLFFVYAIFLPNYRFKKRYEIFALRDQLRYLRLDNKSRTMFLILLMKAFATE